MILHDTSVFLFRCSRCSAAYVLSDPKELVGAQEKWGALIANPCQVCGRGQMEYLGEFYGRHKVVESPR